VLLVLLRLCRSVCTTEDARAASLPAGGEDSLRCCCILRLGLMADLMPGRGSGSSSLLESAARIILLAHLATLLSRRIARCSATAAAKLVLLSLLLPAAALILLARAGASGDGLLLRLAASLPADESLVSPPTKEERI
jgi:hypothetical protein